MHGLVLRISIPAGVFSPGDTFPKFDVSSGGEYARGYK